MKKNRVLTAVFIIGCIAVIGIAGFVTVFARDSFGNDDLICKGISIGNIDVGGLTAEQANQKAEAYISAHLQQTVAVEVAGHTVTATAGAIGLAYPAHDYGADALAIGKHGNLWERFQEIRRAEKGECDLTLDAEISEETLQKFVKDQCGVYDVKAKNSKLKYKNGKLKATKSKDGLEVQVDETVERLKEALQKGASDTSGALEVEAEVETTEPEFTQEEAAQCTDLLGKYSTTYSTYQVERSSNVATAAGRINGTVVYPGKVFSTVKVIKDRTAENGYKAAPEYSSGKVVSGIGGGVCQVSTTLYNAVINAELKVVERSPHSMVVSYVPVSRDAAISGDYKDFKFKNNTDYPVYIMGSASGGVLTFQIFGHETREEGREISFESEVTDTIEPGEEVVTEDPSLPAGYRSVTQSAHVGYKAKLWKIITIDGVEQDRVLVNTSSYNASPQYVTVGKQAATATPKPTESADSKSGASAGSSASGGKTTAAPKSSGSSESRSSGTSGSAKGKATAAPKSGSAKSSGTAGSAAGKKQ